MDRILEHEVDKVGSWLHEFVQLLQILQFSALFLVENIEVVFGGVQLHVFDLGGQISLLLGNFLIALFKLLLLVLKRTNLLVDLLLHHLIQILLLDLQLLHDATERLLQPVDLIVELLPHLQLKLRVELLAGRCLGLVDLDLCNHFLHHTFHIENYSQQERALIRLKQLTIYVDVLLNVSTHRNLSNSMQLAYLIACPTISTGDIYYLTIIVMHEYVPLGEQFMTSCFC